MVAAITGAILGDVVLTSAEISGLMAGHLAVDSQPTGQTKLREWAQQNADRLGFRYANELKRRLREST
jgi:hypothetical protein